MAIKKIRDTNFRPDSLARIEQLASIVEEYQGQNLRLTARQLYYQLVSRDIIANSVAEYKKLTSLLTDARYAGLIDWSAIEDRNREPNTPSEWDDPAQLVESALRAYRLPRWEGQPAYVELWVEKAALAGVLQPLAREFHATLMVNRGYSSASAMYESAERIKKATITDQQEVDDLNEQFRDKRAELEDDNPDEWESVKDRIIKRYETIVRKAVVLYLGDHDPSGEDMVRDISDRLKEFGVARLSVEKVGLTIAQVKQYNPPPNPAKITDSRAKAYIEKFGHHSWEVDALPPQVLTTLIRAAFRKHIDKAKMDEVKKREETDKALLRKAVAGMMAGR